MSTVIAIPFTTSTMNIPDASAARKRRREILSSKRNVLENLTTPIPDNSTIVSSSFISFGNNEEEHSRKARRRVSNCSGSSSKCKKSSTIIKKKKTQMRYDPDVPMSEEETSVWRIDQRRKRNRESAALTRQRQRNRIGDLTIEVDEWKTKVETIMERVKKLEKESGIDSSKLVQALSLTRNIKKEEDVVEHSFEFEVVDYSDISSTSSSSSNDDTSQSKFASPLASPPRYLSSLPAEVSPNSFSNANTGIECFSKQAFPDYMISTHYFPITRPDDFISILLPPDECLSEDDAVHHVVPDRCNISGSMNNNINININNNITKKWSTDVPTSSSATTTLDDPVESLLFPVNEDDNLISVLLTDKSTEVELGEFLLDAMQWPKSKDSISSVLPISPPPEICLPGDIFVHHVVAPDECNSGMDDNNNNINATHDLIDSLLSPVNEEDKLTVPLIDQEPEVEFGEFLADAIHWL